MENILVVLPVEQRHRDQLEAAAPGQCFVYTCGAEPTREQTLAADIIIGNVPAGPLAAADRLKWLQLNSAGADAYIQPGALRPGVILTNASGAYGKAVSEHAFAMTLMLTKKLHLYRDAQRQSRWTDYGTVSSLSNAIVLVVGLGDIGLRYARLTKALGAYVIGVKRRAGACPEGVDELYTTDALYDLLPRADVIMSILPGSAGTYHMYTAAYFDRMKESAVFINCGRGGVVDGAVLYEALSRGKIAAAGIDVTEPEPLPADSPLWQLDNLLITPHVSGFYHLPETFERIVDIAAENLAIYFAGGTVKNIVDFETGYRR